MMDENTRRYYLDAMGIQCWESLDAPRSGESQGDVNAVESAVENAIESTVKNTVKNGSRQVAADYASVEESVLTCSQCMLHKNRKQAIVGRGNQAADLMFAVLSPTANDDDNNLLCSGETGELLAKMLAAININIDDVYITALLKCSVPANHTISPKEIQSCNAHLKQLLQSVRPKLLVVLGETAARCLLQKELSIDDSRALNQSLSQRLDSVPLFFSYSPEELLQQPADKRKAWSDLQLLQKIIEKNYR